MQIQLNEILNSIIKGLLQGNEKQVISNMLLQTDHSIEEFIANDEASFTKIYEFLTPTAFSVLASLKEQLGDELILIDEDGDEVDVEGV